MSYIYSEHLEMELAAENFYRAAKILCMNGYDVKTIQKMIHVLAMVRNMSSILNEADLTKEQKQTCLKDFVWNVFGGEQAVKQVFD